MLVIDGFPIATTPGAMLRLACGDHALAEGVFAEGADFDCADCETTTTIVAVLAIDIVPVVTV